MKYYEINGALDPNVRGKLVQNVISTLIVDKSYSISSNVMSELADAIVSLFPTEAKESYFLITQTKKRKVCSGKLYDRYKNYKYFLSKCNKQSSSPKSMTRENFLIAAPTEEDDGKILWLKHNTSPWDKVVQLWDETAHIRVRKNNSEGCLNSIVKEWPPLKQPEGYTLVR